MAGQQPATYHANQVTMQHGSYEQRLAAERLREQLLVPDDVAEMQRLQTELHHLRARYLEAKREILRQQEIGRKDRRVHSMLGTEAKYFVPPAEPPPRFSGSNAELREHLRSFGHDVLEIELFRTHCQKIFQGFQHRSDQDRMLITALFARIQKLEAMLGVEPAEDIAPVIAEARRHNAALEAKLEIEREGKRAARLDQRWGGASAPSERFKSKAKRQRVR